MRVIAGQFPASGTNVNAGVGLNKGLDFNGFNMNSLQPSGGTQYHPFLLLPASKGLASGGGEGGAFNLEIASNYSALLLTLSGRCVRLCLAPRFTSFARRHLFPSALATKTRPRAHLGNLFEAGRRLEECALAFATRRLPVIPVNDGSHRWRREEVAGVQISWRNLAGSLVPGAKLCATRTKHLARGFGGNGIGRWMSTVVHWVGFWNCMEGIRKR
ncbi:hypothetical protein KM043_006508 [Ampulex compressa]|nr:hypothetical protein KM043_006508 [Ampulex compressa]